MFAFDLRGVSAAKLRRGNGPWTRRFSVSPTTRPRNRKIVTGGYDRTKEASLWARHCGLLQRNRAADQLDDAPGNAYRAIGADFEAHPAGPTDCIALRDRQGLRSPRARCKQKAA